MARFVSSIGGYLPLLRAPRSDAAKAMRFAGASNNKGRRAVAGWDEDPVTMAVEAARGPAREGCDALVFASTSAPFYDRPHSAIAVDALALPRTTTTQDVANSRRAATTALLQALKGQGSVIVTAGEKRPAQLGSAELLAFGEGAAACRVADSGGLRFIGAVTSTHDFVDSYASREHPFPYPYEARFVREILAGEILAPTLRALEKETGVALKSIAIAAVPEPVAGIYAAAAKAVGLTAANVSPEVALHAGELGAAHPLFAFGLALARAKPGDHVLLVGLGGGCDALLFEITGEVTGAADFPALLNEGRELNDITRFLYLSGCVDVDWGMRSEAELKAQATVLERYTRDFTGFIGGRDSSGSVQFPKSRVPVNPDLRAPEVLTDVRLADETATVVSYTSDRLNFSPDPPFEFGLTQFSNGARVMMEFTDRGEEPLAVGAAVRMRFRIKSHDRRRGFRTYFWKAVPIARPKLKEI